MASKAYHPIVSNAIKRIKRNFHSVDLPEYIKYPCNLYDEVFFSAPILITMSYFGTNNIEGNKVLICLVGFFLM